MITVKNTRPMRVNGTTYQQHYYGLAVTDLAEMNGIDPNQYRDEMESLATLAKRANNPTDQNAQSMWRWSKKQMREAHGKEIANVIIAGAEQFDDIVWE